MHDGWKPPASDRDKGPRRQLTVWECVLAGVISSLAYGFAFGLFGVVESTLWVGGIVGVLTWVIMTWPKQGLDEPDHPFADRRSLEWGWFAFDRPASYARCWQVGTYLGYPACVLLFLGDTHLAEWKSLVLVLLACLFFAPILAGVIALPLSLMQYRQVRRMFRDYDANQ